MQKVSINSQNGRQEETDKNAFSPAKGATELWMAMNI